MLYHLRNKITGDRYRNGGNIDPKHPVPSADFEWAEGAAPAGAPMYKEATKSDSLLAMFDTLPLKLRAAFAPVKEAVSSALVAGDYELAREIINQQKVPAELSAVKAQMLAAFDG